MVKNSLLKSNLREAIDSQLISIPMEEFQRWSFWFQSKRWQFIRFKRYFHLLNLISESVNKNIALNLIHHSTCMEIILCQLFV